MMTRRKVLLVALCLVALVVGGAAYALTRQAAPGRNDIDTLAEGDAVSADARLLTPRR